MGLDTERFRNTVPPNGWGNTKVMLVGCGGIGSYVALALTRMGLRDITLVDMDTVEHVNVATQDLGIEDVGMLKTSAVADRIDGIDPSVHVCTIASRYTASVYENYRPHVLITAVDSIEAREEIVMATLGVLRPDDPLDMIIDPRMGFESLEVYTWMRAKSALRDEHHEAIAVAYLKTLQERDHQDAPCGAKAIAYTGMFAGAVVASIMRRWLCKVTVPYLVTGDIGSYEFITCWREGESYEEIKIGR